MTMRDFTSKSDIFRCSVCQKADLFPLEPPVVLCNHCQSILQIPAVVPCPKCNDKDSQLIGALDADSQRTTAEAGDKFAALVMFGPLGRAAVDLAPGFREKMASIKRAFTGAGAYFSCKQCKEHWAILLPTTRACLFAPDPGTRRDAALAFTQGLQVNILQDLTGLIGRLIDLLQDTDELVRAAAAATLGLHGNVLSIPALAAAALNASEATKAVFDQSKGQLRESEASATAKCKTALGRELKPLEAAVFMSWCKHLKGWQSASTFPEIPSKKLTGATGRYAKIGSQEVVVGLIDHTIFGSAKDGFLATTSAFYWNYVGPLKSGHIAYKEIEPSSVTYDSRTRRLSAGGRGLVDPPGCEGQAIANFLYEVSYSFKDDSTLRSNISVDREPPCMQSRREFAEPDARSEGRERTICPERTVGGGPARGVPASPLQSVATFIPEPTAAVDETLHVVHTVAELERLSHQAPLILLTFRAEKGQGAINAVNRLREKVLPRVRVGAQSRGAVLACANVGGIVFLPELVSFLHRAGHRNGCFLLRNGRIAWAKKLGYFATDQEETSAIQEALATLGSPSA